MSIGTYRNKKINLFGKTSSNKLIFLNKEVIYVFFKKRRYLCFIFKNR